MRTFLKYFLLLSLVLLGVSLWQSTRLPEPNELVSGLQEEPQQRLVHMAPFDVDSGGITYTVKPLYSYDLTGLVVSKHNANAWWDYIHREWHDELNVTDLCVVWGNDVNSDIYQRTHFSSGQFVCYFEFDSQKDYEAFDQTAASNNHLLSDNPRIAKLMRKVKVGDQVHFRGYLAEYSHNHGFPFKRGTSITRTDSGNGACETVYVEDFQILREGGKPWRLLVWVSGIMLVIGVLGWFMQPVRFDD